MGSRCLIRVIAGVVRVAGRCAGSVETIVQEEFMGYFSKKGWIVD